MNAIAQDGRPAAGAGIARARAIGKYVHCFQPFAHEKKILPGFLYLINIPYLVAKCNSSDKKNCALRGHYHHTMEATGGVFS